MPNTEGKPPLHGLVSRRFERARREAEEKHQQTNRHLRLVKQDEEQKRILGDVGPSGAAKLQGRRARARASGLWMAARGVGLLLFLIAIVYWMFFRSAM